MVTATVEPRLSPVQPALAFFLAASVPLFLGAVLSDWAYRSTFEVQWSNFANWLIAGGLVFGGFALACALFGLRNAGLRRGAGAVGLVLALGMWVLGLIDAFVHARDAWAIMPTGFVLSVVVFVLCAAATWLAFAGLPRKVLP